MEKLKEWAKARIQRKSGGKKIVNIKGALPLILIGILSFGILIEFLAPKESRTSYQQTSGKTEFKKEGTEPIISSQMANLFAAGKRQAENDKKALKGAVIGGVVGGLASYLIHGSLEFRDARVRRETLFNLEKYDVLGRENVSPTRSTQKDKCYTTREVDGRQVSIPCRYVEDSGDFDGSFQ